jgi:hypothetical protein
MARFHYEKGNAFAFARFMTLFTPPKAKLPVETF